MFSKAIIVASVAAALTGSVHAVNGRATYYLPNGGFGACGVQNQNSDLVAALSPADYNGGANCFRRIRVSYQGKFVDVTVVDLCPGCEAGHIDLSIGAFQRLANTDLGNIPVVWNYE